MPCKKQEHSSFQLEVLVAKNSRRSFMKQTALGAAALLAYPAARALGANDRVRVAIIGVGDRGQELVKQALKLPSLQLVVAADIYTRRLEQAKQLVPGIQTVSDYRRVLDRNDIDAVMVASPLHLHALHFQDVLAAGKDLYSEKTMTWSIPEAERCLAAAKKSDRVIQIGLQHESSGPFMDAKKWIADGLVGKVTHVESWMSRNTPRGKGQWVRAIPSDCTAQNVDWKAFLNGRPEIQFDPYKFINWRLFWEFSGGNITENMIHQVAWIMSALDLPLPVAAYMAGGVFSEKDGRQVPDTIAVTLEFPHEVVVTWQSTFSNSRYGLGQRILGSDGTVEYVAGANDMVTGNSEERINYYPEPTNRPQGEPMAGRMPTQDHIANWMECVRSRRTPNAPVDLGYRSAVAAHMSNLAYRRKQRITLEEAMAATPEY
jgi:predicted dehydrogenase